MIYVVEVKHIVGRKTWQAPCLADSILNHREMLWMLTWKDSCGKSEHSGMQGASTSAAGLHTAPFRRQWREIKHNVLQSGDTSSNYLNKMSSLFFFYFNTCFLSYFFILYYDQQMHNYFTNYHTAICFDTVVSSLWSCIWNTCVTWQGIGYKLHEDDTIVCKHIGVS